MTRDNKKTKNRFSSSVSVGVALAVVVSFIWLAIKLKDGERPIEGAERKAASLQQLKSMGQSAGY